MNEPFDAADDADETFQEGVTPVQVFYSPVIDPSTTEPRLRLGCPPLGREEFEHADDKGERISLIQVFHSPAVHPSTVEPRNPRGGPPIDSADSSLG
jgi:hypothetical protein